MPHHQKQASHLIPDRARKAGGGRNDRSDRDNALKEFFNHKKSLKA